MKKKLLIGLLASLMAFSFAAACGENDKPDNSGSNVNTESSDTGSDTGSETSKYTVTLRNGNPMLGGTVEEMQVEAGAALELPTLTADGKTFKGWFAMNPETNEPTVAAPATMPEEAIALYAVWEITPYTLTIVNGDTTTEVKFGVEYDFANGIELTVTDLAFFLADQLPEGTEDAAYKWAEEVPAEFALQNYTFTVNEVAPVTVTLVNGPLWDMASMSFVYLAEGAKLDLPFLTADGKIFQGWFSFSYDDEGNEIATPAPETVPAEGIALTAVWEVIPYTISITVPNVAEPVVIKIGVEDVYADDPADEIVAYNNPYSIEYKIEKALLAYATEEIVYEVELPTNAETGEVEFELKNYEFTATEAERVFTVYLNRGESQTYKFGDAIELPTPDPIEGATFVKWVYYYYNEETFEMEQRDVPATASSIIDEVSFQQLWNVTPYTVTLHNVVTEYVWNEETQTDEPVIGTAVIKFGAMTDFANGIETTPENLAWTINFMLPEDYIWTEELPETFELKDYEFTARPDGYALTLRNGNPMMGGTADIYYYKEGATLELPTLEAAGKNFLGWFAMDPETGNPTVTAPETMPAEAIALYAVWEHIDYKLTIVNGTETTEFIFQVDYESGAMISVNDLAYVLEDNLPENTEYYIYSWAEAIPETWTLQDYTFTVVQTKLLLTIPEALALGAQYTKDTYTTQKYYVVGTIKNVYNTTYGNMYIVDEEGNELCVYGTYSADGSTRYDKMATKPVAGDTVKVYGVIGSYNDPQMKDGWIVEHTAHEHNYDAVVTEPTCTMAGYTTHTCSACEDSYKDTEVAALGHTTEEGFCERCQQTVGGDVVVAQYEKVTSASEFTTGTYVLVVNTKNITVSTFDGSWVKGSELSADNIIDKATGDALAITLEVSDAGVKIKIGDTYIKPKGGNNNGIFAGDYTWAYEFQADGTVVFNGVGSDTVSLAYNVQNAGFRAYKTITISGNASGYPSFFTAYKLVG